MEQKEAGFTLVELLVALTLFAVGLLAVAGMQVAAVKANASAHSLTTAAAVAQRTMEEILILSSDHATFAAPDKSDVIWDLDPDDPDSTTLNLDGAPSLQASYSTTVGYNSVDDLVRIEVSVQGGILDRPVTLSAFKKI